MTDKSMSGAQKTIETSSNVISTFGGIYGAAWGIGWEGGRVLTQNDWYQNNVRPVLQDALYGEHDKTRKEEFYLLENLPTDTPAHK